MALSTKYSKFGIDQVFHTGWIEHRLRIGQLRCSEMLPASVNDEDLPGDIGRGVAEEEHGRIGDILDVPAPTQGDAAGKGAGGCVAEPIHACRLADASRRDDVGSDAMGTFLYR